MRTTTRPAALAASVLLLGASAITSAAVTSASAAPSRPPVLHDDFNADQYQDVVVAAPSATVKGGKGAGYIVVMYGSAQGLTRAKSLMIDQSSPGVPGTPERGDAFGASTASGDIDHDGFPDLIVGAPGEDVRAIPDIGTVIILWGSREGLSGTNSDSKTDSTFPPGYALGTGLAVAELGGVNQLVILTRDNLRFPQFYSPHDAGRAGRSVRAGAAPVSAQEEEEPPFRQWGDEVTATGLAVGDFDGDGHDDVVILGTSARSGRTLPWGWYRPGGPQLPGTGVFFPAGTVGAAGDIDQDGYDDLVSSYPDQLDAAGKDTTGGTVHVHYGGPKGLDAADAGRQDRFTQETPHIRGSGEPLDRFGSDLSVDDVDGDGYPEVVIGAPGEDVGTVKDAGAVWVLHGSAGGLTSESVQFHQNRAGIPGVPEAGDRWGAQVRLTDTDYDNYADLLAAAPGENSGRGVVWVLHGTRLSVTASNSWTFSATSLGAPSDGARFGSVIAE